MLELLKAEIGRRLDEIAQRGEHLPVGHQAVRDHLGHALAVGLQMVLLDLLLPLADAKEGQPDQPEGEQHRPHETPPALGPQGAVPIEKAQRKGREDDHPQRVAHVPVPPRVGVFDRVDHPEAIQARDPDRGRDQAGQHAAQEQETQSIALTGQLAPALADRAPHQPRADAGLERAPQRGAQPDAKRRGRRLADQQRMGQIEQQGAEGDPHQPRAPHPQHAGQRHPGRRKDRAGKAGGDGQQHAERTEQRVNKRNPDHTARGYLTWTHGRQGSGQANA